MLLRGQLLNIIVGLDVKKTFRIVDKYKFTNELSVNTRSWYCSQSLPVLFLWLLQTSRPELLCSLLVCDDVYRLWMLRRTILMFRTSFFDMELDICIFHRLPSQ